MNEVKRESVMCDRCEERPVGPDSADYCDPCEEARIERAYESFLSDFYGGSGATEEQRREEARRLK